MRRRKAAASSGEQPADSPIAHRAPRNQRLGAAGAPGSLQPPPRPSLPAPRGTLGSVVLAAGPGRGLKRGVEMAAGGAQGQGLGRRG